MAIHARTFPRCISTAALLAVVSTFTLGAQDKKKHTDEPTKAAVPSYYGPQPATEDLDLTMYARIRTEGLQHSKAMQLLGALTDGIGPRLTGSPNMAKANAWTRDTLTAMGLENAHLEDWGEFGMGWQQINTWARMVSPDPEPLWMEAAPWSPATKGPVSGEVVYLPLTEESELTALKGKLAGKIVLLGAMRPTPDITEPLLQRYTDADLKEFEGPPAPRPARVAVNPADRARLATLRANALKMMSDEGVAAIITPSRDGRDGGGTGIIFDDNGANLVRGAQVADTAVKIPNAVMMIEHYNRLARMVTNGVPVQVEVNIDTKFTGDHEHGFNTVAEIPGTDPKLKDEIVMVGGHLDSWISATGATDNGTGAVAAMEAVRILKALNIKPRRTIRIALWSGEEEGEFGSQGYVKQHFGSFAPAAATADGGGGGLGRGRARGPLTTTKEWETLDAYYNLDNGAGRIRGIYAQSNFAIGPIFKQWIAPLGDLGVSTVTERNTGSTDHESFDAVGLAGFEFLQDPLDYDTRTHHSNMDTYDRVHEADLEQAAVVEAIFLYNTAQRDAMMPRKPFPHPEDEQKLAAPLKGIYPNAVEPPATQGRRRQQQQ